MIRTANWAEIYQQLSVADRSRVLDARELESLAIAAYLTGRDAEGVEGLSRAHKSHLDQQNTQHAVRCAFWLGIILLITGESARAGGWIARAERIVTDKGLDCAEKGLLLIPFALRSLMGGDAVKAQMQFEKALATGNRFNDRDLIALARLGLGQSLIQLEEVARGITLLDEVMIAAETEEIFPVARGIIYCAVVEACRKVWDLKRAQEWTSALNRWCASQPDLVPFRGQCLVRRAEIMQFYGEWTQALVETRNACRLLTRPPGEPAAGEAYYRKAELHRLRGHFDKAEDCYREAAKWGKKPQPGLALLRLSQGQADVAETSVRNVLHETANTLTRAELLPAVVTIMIAVKQFDEARNAAEEMLHIATVIDVPYLHAISLFCLGAVCYAEGDHHQALNHLQKAAKWWNALDIPYDSARTCEMKGLVYRTLGDKENAELEIAAARWIFEQLKAAPDLQRIDQLMIKRQMRDVHGLTLRELQVLRRVTSGMTNKSIAGDLFISERTVDRHMSNIFNKLGVSSRTAATTFAIRRNLFEGL